MEIKGITHLGITVTNLEKSIEWYKDVLGFELVSYDPEPYEDEREGNGVGLGRIVFKWCTFDAGGGQLLELIEYIYPESTSKPPRPCDKGCNHISFMVDDIKAWIQNLTEKGVEFNYKSVVDNFTPITVDGGVFDGVTWIYFKDPDGISLELMEYPTGAVNAVQHGRKQ